MENKNKDYTNYKNSRQLVSFLTALALILGVFIGVFSSFIYNRFLVTENNYNSPNKSSNYFDTRYIEGVLEIFQDKYIGDFDEIKENYNEYTYAIIKGLISNLDDRYTAFLTPKEAEAYLNQASGNFEGIGVTLAYNEYGTYVESVLKSHPAEEAGILPGDLIIFVDEENVKEKLPSEVASLIRGEKDTSVKIKVDRKNQEIDFKITRKTIKIDNITWEKVDDKTIKINIVQFSDESIVLFNKSWEKVVEDIKKNANSIENIIIDLRGNPGGYVSSVKYVLEEFLQENQILMQERSKKTGIVEYKDKRNGAFENKNIVVIVNEGSASAAEIFASSIQENQRGLVVGNKTVGKGVEQELITLPDNSMLLLVFQEWLTPKGNKITEEEPVKPDFEVEYTIEDYKNNNDTQLKKALEILNK